jgi:hypothetical protein
MNALFAHEGIAVQYRKKKNDKSAYGFRRCRGKKHTGNVMKMNPDLYDQQMTGSQSFGHFQ